MRKLAIRTDPKTNSEIAEVRVWAPGPAQQGGEEKGWRTWRVLVDGEGGYKDLAKGGVETSAPGVARRRRRR